MDDTTTSENAMLPFVSETTKRKEANNGFRLRKVISTIHIVMNNTTALYLPKQLSSSLSCEDLDNAIATSADD
jgi:hypothetical protein